MIELSDEHIYRVDGIIVLGVNEILQAEGLEPDFSRFGNDYKLRLGEYIHQAIKLYWEDNLDESSLQGEVKDYFEGFKKFHDENPVVPLEVEKSFYSEKWGFCGTIDFFTQDTLFDVKTGGDYPYYALQMGGYKILLEEAGYKVDKVKLVFLKPNDYIIKEITADSQTFLAALMVYKWKRRQKCKQ